MSQVFISYSRENTDFVRQLAHHLEEAGYDTWWDVSELRGGDAWLRVIQSAVRGSEYCIVVLSPDAVDSEWVEREYYFALQSGVKVVPVLYQTCAVPLALANLQYIDFRRRRYQLALSRLLAALDEGQTPPVDPTPVFRWPFDALLKVVVLAVVILALVGGGWAISRYGSSPPDTIGVTPSFEGQLRIENKHTQGPIPDAEVSVEVTDMASLGFRAGATGLAKILISPDYVGQRGSLIVEADGYQKYSIPVVLTEDGLPDTVQLEALPPPTPTHPPTFTLAPTDTPLPPTETPTPTDTPLTPTNTPTPAPTDTPVPPTTARPAYTATLAPTASPTAPATQSPSMPVGQFVLLKPVPPDVSTSGLTEFEWRWSGPFEADQGFEVRVWREGEPPSGVHDAVEDNTTGKVEFLGDNTYRLTVDITNAKGVQGRSGEYLWTVLLVQVGPEYQDLGIQAEPGRLRLDIPGPPDDGKKPIP